MRYTLKPTTSLEEEPDFISKHQSEIYKKEAGLTGAQTIQLGHLRLESGL